MRIEIAVYIIGAILVAPLQDYIEREFDTSAILLVTAILIYLILVRLTGYFLQRYIEEKGK